MQEVLEQHSVGLLAIDRIRDIVRDVQYRDWMFNVVAGNDDVILLKITPDDDTGALGAEITPFTTWYVDDDMSFQQIIQLIFLAVSTIEKHALNSEFSYRGARIFQPHASTDKYIKAENRIVDPMKAWVIASLDDIRKIVSEIRFRHWEFNVFEENGVPMLQIQFKDTDSLTGVVSMQYSRRWAFEYHVMGEMQVIQTCYLAVSTAVRHESREQLLYRKKWISNPHRSVSLLVEERQ
ncbi:MAG: hypothetical protein JNM58_04615 [Xanthomonadaceae bacterium]|nr:hypothetical protein [Xanthomonadaceae bacterium]